MKRNIIFILSLIVVAASGILAQKPTPTPKNKPERVIVTDGIKLPASQNPPLSQQQIQPPDLPTILGKANEQTIAYQEEFKNLLGEETKTFQTFDKNGKPKKQTVVESNFIVYQSLKDALHVTEYRNVVKVDGKLVGDSEKRATDLFEQLGKTASPLQELENIEKESSRYDKTLDINGFTLFQSPVLAEHIRPFFDFRLDGQETIDGSDVYVISYQQKGKSPYVILNDDQPKPDKLLISFDVDISSSIKEPNELLRGKIWIDKQTFQIRREQRELTIQPAELSSPLVVNETQFEYHPSDLGILTPKEIVYTDYNVKSKNKGKDISALLDSKTTFEYKKFTKSDVEVKSGDVKN